MTHVWYRGPHTDYRLETAAGPVEIRRAGPPVAKPGERITWTLRRVWQVPDGRSGGAAYPKERQTTSVEYSVRVWQCEPFA